MTQTTSDPMDGARDPGREELLKTAAAPVPKKKKRWILRIVLATPLVIALLVLMAPTILSTGPARRKIESAAAEATGRRVTLEDHSLGWWAPVSIQNFVMYEKDGTTPFLKVGSMVVKVDLLPLKEGNVVLRTLEISGVEVRIVKHRDGTLSTDDIGQKPPGASKAPEPKSDGKGGAFTMGAVTVKDVNVTYIDEAAGSTYRVTGLTLTAKPGASPDDIVAEISAKVQSGSAAAGEVSVKATAAVLSAGKPRAEVTADATVGFKGFDVAAMMPMKGVEWATGAVEGTVNAKLLAGGNVDAQLFVKVPSFRWGDPGAIPLVATYVTVKQDVGWKKKENRLEFKQNGKFEMHDADVQVQGTIDFPTDEHDTDNPVDLVVKFDAETATLRQVLPSSLGDQDIRGTIRTNWNVSGRNLGKLDIQGMASLESVQVPTDYTYQTHGEDGKTTWYKIPHPGFLTVKTKGSFDLDRRATLAERSPGRPWASLDGLVMNVTVETPWIKSEAADLKQVLIEVSLNEQACDIRHLDFRLNDGDVKCTGTIAFDALDPAWTFRTTVGNPPVKYSTQFSGLAALINPALYSTEQGQVEASMAWDISLKARGFNMDAIKKSVVGDGSLGLRNVSLAGSPMVTELYSKLQVTDKKKLEFSVVDQKFHIAGGKVTNDFSNWQGDDKAANISIAGETDFDGNLKQTITVTGDPTARWGKRTGTVVDVFNKAGGLPLGGTVASPKIDIDFEKALEGVAKGLLENPDVKEKVDDLLNGIFKKKKKK